MMNNENITRLRAELHRWYEGEASPEQERRLLSELEQTPCLPDDMLPDLRLLQALREEADAELQRVVVPPGLEKKLREGICKAAADERRRASRWKVTAWAASIAACVAAIVILCNVMPPTSRGGLDIAGSGYASASDSAETIRDCRANPRTIDNRASAGTAAPAAPQDPAGSVTNGQRIRAAAKANDRKQADALSPEQMRILSAGLTSVRSEMQNATRESAAEFADNTSSASNTMRGAASDVKNVKCEIENINDNIKISL